MAHAPCKVEFLRILVSNNPALGFGAAHYGQTGQVKFKFNIDRSTHGRCSVRKGVLRNSVKFTEKTPAPHLC